MTHADLLEEGIDLHAIVAMASNRVIGREGTLPWHLPEDLKLFKARTLGHPIIMGRATFESLPKQKPLPKRRNIVLSKTMSPREGVDVIGELSELPSLGVVGDAYLIGGARVFDAYLNLCSSLILTYVHEAHEGDVTMPCFEEAFTFVETLSTFEEFEVRLYKRNEN